VLGVSATLVNAVGLAVIISLVVLITNILVSLLNRIIPGEIRIPVIIIIVAASVTIFEMLVQAFMPALFSALGIFLPLVVCNCLVFGRAEAFAMRNRLLPSIVDALGASVGLGFAFVMMGAIREILGTGAIDLFGLYVRIFPSQYAVSLFIMPAGAFIVLGMLCGAVVSFRLLSQDKKAERMKKQAAGQAAKPAQAV
jgi:electron transport complex protein RnfE